MHTKSSPAVSQSILNDQFARCVFELLPEDGPMLILIDRDGRCLPNDAERFAELNLTEAFLKDLCAKVDDGDEPIVTPVHDCTLVASQVATDNVPCGYAIIAMPHYSPESAMANIDLIEIVLNQFDLIAKLTEDVQILHKRQTERYVSFLAGSASLN